MKVVVDSNIVFSAILGSRIGQILTLGSQYFSFYSIDLLKEEILNHEEKILRISRLSSKEFLEAFEIVTSKIKFIDQALISNEQLKAAMELTKNIDEDDAVFVALTNHLDAFLWTGDKKLENGLKKKGWEKVIKTNELREGLLKMILK